MKKKLEAELISIAHRILKLKNKSELIQLHQETAKLYEKLSVLMFVENNFSDAKPTIGQPEIIQKITEVFESNEVVATPIVETPIPDIEIEAPAIAFEPHFETKAAPEDVIEAPIIAETTSKTAPQQISFQDLLGHTYNEPVFEKINKDPIVQEAIVAPVPEPEIIEAVKETVVEKPKKTSVLLNDILSKNISFGLNDKIGFEKQLFGGSAEDMNRVVSQLNTFDTLQEALDFIENMVKPDYNNWEGKEDYAQRFMEIVEKRFS